MAAVPVSRNVSQAHTQNIMRPDNKQGPSLNVPDPVPQNLTGSSYTMASTQSQFSYAVDNWIRGPSAGASSPPNHHLNNTTNGLANGIQSTRPVQSAPRMPPQPPGFATEDNTGIWYTLAMILPLFTMNNARAWGCSASTIFHAAQFFTAQISILCRGIHRNLRNLTQDRIARDIFATIMDVILIVYAMGFLVLSMYQASIFN